MSSNPTQKPTEPDKGDAAAADKKLTSAYEVIKNADEQLARLSEQVAKIERDAARQASARSRPSAPGKLTRYARVGLVLAACVIVVALILQWSHGGGAKVIVALWSPQPVPPLAARTESPPSAALPLHTVATAEAVPPAAPPDPQPAPQAAAPQAPAPAVAAAPDQTELLQTLARDLENLQRSIQQLNATQQQIAKTAGDNSRDIAELKASQQDIKRALAKASEQNVSRTSAPPPAQPAAALRKPEQSAPPQRPRPRPRIPSRYWYDDDW